MFEATMTVLITLFFISEVRYRMAVRELRKPEPLMRRFFVSKIAHLDGKITKKVEA